jgi:hypothetical protein
MSLSIRDIDLRIVNMRARMPFRFGIVTMTALPHLFLRAECKIDGQLQTGIAADHLPPKWFTKDPNTHFRDDLTDMIDVIRLACSHALSAGPHATVFDLWNTIYAAQKAVGTSKGYPPLLWGFGVSLVERALIDAFCRVSGITFGRALRENRLGLDLPQLYRQHVGDPAARLPSLNPSELLCQQPPRQVLSRHTIGLADPLTDADIAAADRVTDGLPQSFEACIRTYGLSRFKVKLFGNLDTDLPRLRAIAEVIERNASPTFAFTLDFNENFSAVEPFRAHWESLAADRSLANFLQKLLFIEQPLHRNVALSPQVKMAMSDWPNRPPVIIDESDSEIGSLIQALDCGYAGTSHKNCKGVIKSIASACLLKHLRRTNPTQNYILSSEDLSNVGPVSLPQDLAVAVNLGISHVERNGHHYFAGLSMFPPSVQEQVLAQHPDLYRRHAAGYPTLNIMNGAISVGSVLDAPFGVGFELDTSQFTRLDDWTFGSLGLSDP